MWVWRPSEHSTRHWNSSGDILYRKICKHQWKALKMWRNCFIFIASSQSIIHLVVRRVDCQQTSHLSPVDTASHCWRLHVHILTAFFMSMFSSVTLLDINIHGIKTFHLKRFLSFCKNMIRYSLMTNCYCQNKWRTVGQGRVAGRN